MKLGRVAVTVTVAVMLMWSTVPLMADSLNLLTNPGFEEGRPLTPITNFGRYKAGPAAATGWKTWANANDCLPGAPCNPFVTTELVPSTLPGGGEWMMHISTNGYSNGVYQFFAPVRSGPKKINGAVWVRVTRGIVVAIGTGSDGRVRFDAHSRTAGQWELLTGLNGVTPANEFIVYAAAGGGAEFYIDNAMVKQVPEPAALVLTATGLLAGRSRRLKRRA